MTAVIDRVRGKIVGYDERRGVVTIEAPYEDFVTMCRREYKEVEITMLDSRPLSDKQRKSCYAMIREIALWSGYEPDEIKDMFKFNFLSALEETMNTFSLSDAPMSLVAAFQTFLARFIVRRADPAAHAGVCGRHRRLCAGLSGAEKVRDMRQESRPSPRRCNRCRERSN